MSLSYPIDILQSFPGWTTSFELMWRQEQSRQSNGVTRVKDFGEPLWSLKASTKSLSRRELDYWRARLDSLENGLNTFKGYPLSRFYPIAYPRGTWPTGLSFDGVSAQVHSIGGDNKSLALDHLPVGYVVSIGDMISINWTSGKQSLHRVMEPGTANGSGITGTFEVRPHLTLGVATTNVTSVKAPWCPMTVVPDSISASSDDSGRGKISFSAVEFR